MGWYGTVKKAFYEALCSAFDLNPDSQQALNKFIPAYEEETIKPQAPRNLDVCYYAIGNYQGDSDLDYMMVSQVSVNGVWKTEIKKSVPASVLVTFYGPNADDEAETFWSMFQWDKGYGSPRGILRGYNIVPIGEPERPVSLYEIEGTYQRRRSDVRVNIAYQDVVIKNAPIVTSPPEIVTALQKNG